MRLILNLLINAVSDVVHNWLGLIREFDQIYMQKLATW